MASGFGSTASRLNCWMPPSTSWAKSARSPRCSTPTKGGGAHVAAVDEAAEHLVLPKGLPSARIERKVHDKGFLPWTLARAEKLKAKLLAGETSTERLSSSP